MKIERNLMKLTVEQLLQQGVTAHREGKLQDAERNYRAILQSQPEHPDANHNLGVLAISFNKVPEALPLFKTALDADPKIEQFWFSYIDALIKTEKFDNARQALADAQQAGVTLTKLQIFEEQFQSELPASSDKPQQEFGNLLQSYQDALSPAIELREVGKYKEAQEWLNNVIEHDSKNSEALSLLSQVLLLDKKEVEAERALTAAASINSELPSVYRNQARLLLKKLKPLDALKKAELGCEKSPVDPDSLLVLAACLVANQRDSEALSIIEKLLNTKPDYAEAYANRALIKFRAKDTVGAIKDAKMSVSFKPHLAQMWSLLGSMYLQSKNLTFAIEALKKAHEHDPENIAFMVLLGELLRQDNKANRAIPILEQATQLSPKDANAWTNLGVALQQEEKLADAKIAYEKALALNPKSAAIFSNLGAMAKNAEEWVSALKYYKQALVIDPNLSEAHNNLGTMLQELRRLDEAEASYTQAIALKPDFAEAHNNLGTILQELRRLDEAEASYTQAIALKPDFAEAHNNFGATLKDLGRLDEAEASYTQAIALKPDFAEALFNRGYLLFDKEKFEDALKDADACVLKKSKVLPLISLYALGRIDEIYKRIEIESKGDGEDISIAAFAAFISEAQKKPTSYNFCPKPIDFINVTNLSSHVNDSVAYVEELIEELNKIETIWEPSGKSTVNGFQSLNGMNLFESSSGKIDQLKSIIINELASYYLKFQNEPCSYIKNFPSMNNLYGWTVTLKHQGHQSAHIHTSGWLSGVIYLKVVPSREKDEGAIEFSLNDKYYHDDNSPIFTFQPEVGDILFFPSSLHHKTIPFSTDTDRIIISFDLRPDEAKHS